MRRALAFAAVLFSAGLALVATHPVSRAQFAPFVQGPKAVISYTGPGDITAFTVYHGLRAYTGAIAAAGTQKFITIERTANSHTCDLLATANGHPSNTAGCSTGGDNGQTALSFCTSSAGGTGYIVGTTLTLTSGTFTNLDTVYGAGVISGTQIVADLGGGVYTISPTQTVASSGSPEAMTTTDCYPVTWYDQTLGNACTSSSSCDMSTNTRGGSGLPARLYLVFNCFGSQPCVQSSGNDTYLTTASNGANKFTPATGVASFLAEGRRLAATGGSSAPVTVGENTDSANQIRFNGAGSLTMKVAGGTSGGATGTYSDTPTSFHSMIGVLGSGSNNSAMTIDGTATKGTAVGNTTTGPPTMMTNYGPQEEQSTELGFIDNVTWTFPTDNCTAHPSNTVCALHANQAAYWGSP